MISYAAVTLVLGFVMAVGMTLITARMNVETILSLWGSSQEVNIFLSDEATEEQSKQYLKALSKDRRISSAELFQGSDLLKEAEIDEEKLIQDSELLALLPKGIRAEVRSTSSAKSAMATMKELAAEWATKPEISNVSIGYDFSVQFQGIREVLIAGFNGLILCLAFGALVISYQVTHLAIHSRKSEVEILDFLGAQRSFVWTPFVLEILLLTGFAFLGAMTVSHFAFVAFKAGIAMNPWTSVLSENMSGLGNKELLLMAGFFAVVNVSGAYLSLIKLDRMRNQWQGGEG
jgi:cell division protein FtsX